MSRVSYPNRRLAMRHAAAQPVVSGWGDMEEMSLGNVALANARPGDALPRGEAVAAISETTLTIRKSDGRTRRLRVFTDSFDRFVRECGEAIQLHHHCSQHHERVGDLVAMLKRDPACVCRDGVLMLIDTPETACQP